MNFDGHGPIPRSSNSWEKSALLNGNKEVTPRTSTKGVTQLRIYRNSSDDSDLKRHSIALLEVLLRRH